jgi:hypothetical protein
MKKNHIIEHLFSLLLILSSSIYAQDNSNVIINEINSSTYTEVYKNTIQNPKKSPKVTDIIIAKKILKGMVEFGVPKKMADMPNDPQKMLLKISTGMGKLLAKGSNSNPIWFLAYYPNEKYLSVSREYEADYGYDLNSGNIEMGNPENTYISPSNKYLITGAYNGQECYDNKLMLQKNNEYKTIYNFKYETGCYFTDTFWQDDYNFFYSVKIEEYKKKPIWKYYHLEILK